MNQQQPSFRQPGGWNPNFAGQTATGQAAVQPLGDQELAYDLLYQEKALMANMTSDVLEISQPGLRQVMNDAYMQMGQDQLQLFGLMQQSGWYQTKPAQQPDVQTAKTKFQQMRGTL